ncbi:tRNA pseudouridine(38-40) synthase TruA [Blattabacterium cuenoti]|uniref:tRNA pseudouridine(38-40) synthase TruA n=1 Tax=Blattabacterium cuenoti TaxID=1653831 RepID=UPI00293BAE93|nr:tRNA pseudouridine(38-40) synthase TruA [Blattabacterium cuenoti]
MSYNGKNFFGWQKQKYVRTIENEVEYCLSKLLKKSINIIGAGRTDRGVHAKQMVAHFDYEKEISNHLVKRLNIFLPKSIRIHDIFCVKNNIHARFDAIKRTYKYYITSSKDPFYHDFSWHCFYSLDIHKMNDVAKELLKYNDFSSFCKKKNEKKNEKKKCIIYFASWKKEKNILCFTITANRFLRSMVRLIVGSFISIGRGKMKKEEFFKILESKNSFPFGFTVPACGLFLHKIVYPSNIMLKKMKKIY